MIFGRKKSSDNTERSEPQAASIVTYTEEETEAFKNDMEAKNYGGPQVQYTKQKLGTQKQNLEQKKKTWNRKIKLGTEKK